MQQPAPNFHVVFDNVIFDDLSLGFVFVSEEF